MASFSGLWYLQSERKRNDEYFKFLDQYKANIKDGKRRRRPDLDRLSHRHAEGGGTAHVMIYEKGAWVFHMLRILMLDLRTKSEDRFTAMMRDYYMSYRGKPATTEDFQRVVEQHVGMPMDWFFDQWVKGTGIPAYRVAWTNAAGERRQVRRAVT